MESKCSFTNSPYINSNQNTKQMSFITRALVALDFSKMDDHLLSYSHLLSEVIGLDKIYFTHVVPEYFLSKGSDLVSEGAVAIATPVDERIKEKFQEKITNQFKHSLGKTEWDIEVLEGSPYEKILQWTTVKQVDLLITGRKQKSEGSGLTAKRIARRSDCHVLFVPEKTNLAPERILVPLDFSENSVKALRMALNFKKVIPEVKIVAANVIRFMPTDYYFGLETSPLYRKAFLEENKKAYHTLFEKHDLPKEEVEMVFLENNYYNIGSYLNEYAQDNNFDLVIMGAQGHSAFQKFLYGSVTESFVDLCDEIPVFVVR